MQEDLRTLLKIQEKDIRIRELEMNKVEKPQLIQGVRDQFLSKQKALENDKAEMKRLETARKSLELDCDSKQAMVQKYEGQLFQVKTNAEYKALETEIKNLKDQCRGIEDKILDVMEKIENEKKRLVAEEDVLKTERARLDQEEKKLNDLLAEEAKELLELNKFKDELIPKVNISLMERYQRIFENKYDLALVSIEHGACGWCFMRLTPQIINEVKRSQEVIICENCARMLYYQLEM